MTPPKLRYKNELLNSIIVVFMVLLITPADGFFRHLCHGELGKARIDPMMAPGHPSQHIHAIHGASNFGFDPTLDEIMASNCTTCSIMQDKSVYWSPQMYFQHENGVFEIVNKSGGLTAYYFTEKPDVGQNVTAFPKGFRMIAGNSLKRAFFGPQPDHPMSVWDDHDKTQQSLMEKSIGFNCLNYNDSSKTEGALTHHGLRNKAYLDANCTNVRAEIQFPSCWNGHDLDSENHTTHVAYPYLLRNGDCPPGFNVRLPTLFYETIYNTGDFQRINGQFVFANGDPTGYGYHGDFISGWDEGILQQAIDDPHCTTHDPKFFQSNGIQEECPVFNFRSESEIASCTMKIPDKLQQETINMVRGLPGAVKVQSGPGFATVSKGSSTVESPYPAASATWTPYPNTTSAAASPATTSPPTASLAASNLVLTTTSIFVSNGTTINMVIIQEIVTTTVTAELASDTGAVKRHLHKHNKHRGRFGQR